MPLFRASLSGSAKGGPRKRKIKIARREQRGCGSLARLCLWSLAENMKDVWTKDYTQNYMDQYCFRYIMGPFNVLPGHLVEELLSLLSSRHLLARGALHLLLLPQLQRLSLASCSGLVTPSLCPLIAVRCPSLLCLDLSGAQQLCSPVLCQLIGALPSLRSLSLAGTSCDGGIVGTAAARCPALQHLDVSRCHRLAPTGLLPLAYRPDGGGYTRLALRSLLALDIGFGEEEEERAWVAAFLLLALPLLVRAALEELGDACRLIAGRDFARGDGFAARAGVPGLREVWGWRVSGEIGGEREAAGRELLSDGGGDEGWVPGVASESEGEDEAEAEEGERALRGNGGRNASPSDGQGGDREGDPEKEVTLCLQDAQGVTWESLGELGRMCPNLRSLALIGEEGAGQHSARVMAQWAGQLHSLSLQLAGDGDLQEVLPFVRPVGASLTSLTLEGVMMEGSASFLQLLRACPKLKTLHVHAGPPSSAEEEEGDEEEDVEANLRDVPCLPLLHSLKLNFLSDQRQKRPVMSCRALKWALVALLGGSPLLEKVSLTALPCPLDDVFLMVRRRPPVPSKPAPLQCLHDLSMTRCDVSEETVMLLVSSNNHLSFLDLSGCWPVTVNCIMQLQQKATRRRYPLTVVWT
ncbi:hypothetical protein SKAU_G00015290 [Synaphobranchus kaupii]|uniref:Uncharacterized protein n=1 Tax=Synaphobranchus kaupii TaxID=118154 RepID=A0A9Q1GC05_SYNKA|nr:hypothetical protein SKAU_G00015290 [Synaphobranchus kaupii]